MRGKCGENQNNNKSSRTSTLSTQPPRHNDEKEVRRTMRPHVLHGQRLKSCFLGCVFTGSFSPCCSNGTRTVYTVARRRVTPQRNPLSSSLLYRGAKTTSSVKLKDLPQGGLKIEEPYEPDVNDAPQYPPVVQGAKNNMLKFRNCVLLTRVGNFYEACLLPCYAYLGLSVLMDEL